MSYIQGKVLGYGEWTPQQLNVLIMLAYQLEQAEAQADWTTDNTAMLRAVDGISALLEEVRSE